MNGMRHRTAGIAAIAVLASITGGAQPPDTSAVVAEFYPQSLVKLAELGGQPFTRNQCYAVFDTEPSGAPRTIVAAYTNNSSAVIRVLRAGAAAFDVVAEPQGYDFFGSECEVTLVDLDNDGRNDVFITFSEMVNDVSWVFKWDGQQLINLTPLGASWRSGTQPTRLHRAEVVDVDNDGIQEIYVNSQYPPPLDQPAKPDLLFRLVGEQYVEDGLLIGIWEFERLTSTPETDREQAPLPKGARGPYTLHVVNGAPEGQRRVTSGQVWLNGQEIVRPNDFGARVAFIDRPVTLGAENELMVRLAGAPGSKMLVILKSAGWDAP